MDIFIIEKSVVDKTRNFYALRNLLPVICNQWVSSSIHHHWLDSPTCALAFLRSFCQLKYPAIASSDFVTSLFRGGVVSPTPNPRLSWRAMFSVRVVSLS
jgi:hypothetical protein